MGAVNDKVMYALMRAMLSTVMREGSGAGSPSHPFGPASSLRRGRLVPIAQRTDYGGGMRLALACSRGLARARLCEGIEALAGGTRDKYGPWTGVQFNN